MKGYTETAIRELAAIVGVRESSIYNHFPSKNAILECVLEEYAQIFRDSFERDKLLVIVENPTADNIMACMRLAFPKDKEEYYIQQLCVILQEQHRNPIVRKFMAENIILATEQVLRTIIDTLKEFNKLRPDTDVDFWVRTHSSLIYTFASRMLLGIGDQEQDFSGKGLRELLSSLYDMMLKTCAVATDHLNDKTTA